MFIYTIIYQENIIYVGSTLQTMNKRITVHKRNLFNNKPCLLYKFMIENNITFDDIIVETYEQDFIITLSETGIRICNELRIEEGKWIRILLLEGVKLYQTDIPGQTKKEYYENNKEHIKDYQKLYDEANKEQKKQYYETNSESIKEKNKHYRLNNSESIKEKKKKNYIDKKEQKLIDDFIKNLFN